MFFSKASRHVFALSRARLTCHEHERIGGMFISTEHLVGLVLGAAHEPRAQGLRANVGTLIFKTRLVFTRQKRCWHTGVHPPKEVLTHWCSPDRRGVRTLVFTQHDYIQREHN